MHKMKIQIKIFAALALLFSFACTDTGPIGDDWKITSNVEDWRDEIIYQLMVDRFANGDVSNDYNVHVSSPGDYHGGDWQGVIEKLDYLEELGVTALWISPVVKNVEEDAGFASYHGYWTQDFTSVNPHFGDLAKLREMVNACHERGIKVILDIVANHIGQLFYYDINGNGSPDDTLYGSGTRGPLSRTSEWDPDFDERGIQGTNSGGEYGPSPIEFIYMPEINRTAPMPAEFQNEDWYNRKGRVTVWGREVDACQQAGHWDSDDCADGSWWYDCQPCREYVRLQEIKGDFPGGLKDLNTALPEVQEALTEAFKYWIEAADLDGFRIDTVKHVEHEFWQYFCAEVRTFAKSIGKENFFMFGEAFDGIDELIGSFTFDGEMDSVFYFSQKFQVMDGVFKYNAPTKNIESIMEARKINYSDTPNENGPVDADGKGLAPQQLLVNFIDNHDVARFMYENDDISSLHAALFFMFTTDGMPCLYYGTEQEFFGGNDPANREDLWTSEFATDGVTFRHIAELAAMRKEVAALRRGDLSILWSSERTGDEQDAGIFAFMREYKGEKALVVINANPAKASETAFDGAVMQSGLPAGTVLKNVWNDEDNNDTFTVANDGTLTVSVPARGGKVLLVK